MGDIMHPTRDENKMHFPLCIKWTGSQVDLPAFCIADSYLPVGIRLKCLSQYGVRHIKILTNSSMMPDQGVVVLDYVNFLPVCCFRANNWNLLFRICVKLYNGYHSQTKPVVVTEFLQYTNQIRLIAFHWRVIPKHTWSGNGNKQTFSYRFLSWLRIFYNMVDVNIRCLEADRN